MTTTTGINIDTDILQKMMEVGYVAAGSGQWMEAAAIFDGVQAARPGSEYPDIGMAIVLLNAARTDDAIKTLQDSLEEHPESDLAKSFLGLALRQAELTTESDRLLNEVIEADRDPKAVSLAISLLNPSDDE